MPTSNHDIEKLVKDICIHSNQASFHIFFHRYCNRLYAFAFQIIQDKNLSEEVVSDVFTKLWNNRERLIEIKNIEAYLYKSIRNQSLSTLRNSNNGLTYTQITPAVFVTHHNPETSMLDSELEKVIRDTIEDMPKAQQMIFKMIKNDGLKYREVCQILDISVSTVETQMVRAIKKLRLNIALYKEGKSASRKAN